MRKLRAGRTGTNRTSHTSRAYGAHLDTRPPRASAAAPDPADYDERENTELGFLGALGANMAMALVGSTLRELLFSMEGIARFPLADPFSPGNFGVWRQRPRARLINPEQDGDD